MELGGVGSMGWRLLFACIPPAVSVCLPPDEFGMSRDPDCAANDIAMMERGLLTCTEDMIDLSKRYLWLSADTI